MFKCVISFNHKKSPMRSDKETEWLTYAGPLGLCLARYKPKLSLELTRLSYGKNEKEMQCYIINFM